MEQKTIVRIPQDRVGVLIGPKGKTRKQLESILKADLLIDSESGNVTITLRPEQDDVSMLLTSRDIVKAIARGFSPQRALSLLDEDNQLIIMNLEDYVGDNRNAQGRVKGRIIGKEGKSRDMMENLTESIISVYGHTVAIIGPFDRLPIAKEAVEMLLDGAFHKTVWNHLYAYRRRVKQERGELWYEPKRRREP